MRTPRFWQHDGLAGRALAPLSWLYGAGVALDRARQRPQRAALPVIAIGNATAGGAGKTPATIAIAQWLQRQGAAPHLLSRGYGGHEAGVRRVVATDDWRAVGDEPLLLARHAPTWIAPRRLDAARAAKDAGATLAIADDALQHHAFAPDFTLLVIDGATGIGNGRLLPAGPLRESLSGAVSRSDAVLLIGEDAHGVTAGITKPVLRAVLETVGDAGFLRAGKWLAFAGLARPEKFYATLRAHGADLATTRDFADHHPYRDAEVEALLKEAAALGATAITTEKDAVKLPPALRDRVKILPVALRLAEPEALRALLVARGLLQPA